MLGWATGRSGGGYERLTIINGQFTLGLFDLHLLRMKEGTEIKPHTDPLLGREHHRVNILLKVPSSGGKFYAAGKSVKSWLGGRIIKFRPDIDMHAVTPVTCGERLVLTIGYTRKKKCF